MKLRTKYQILVVSWLLLTTTVLNTKSGEVENKVLDQAKYIATPEFTKLTEENFSARLKQAKWQESDWNPLPLSS